jgi:3-methyladenine DNA glycosylase/8-oxoguanine DNA glycosylase
VSKPSVPRLVDGRLDLEQVDPFGERFRPWRTLAAAYLSSSVEP